MRKYLPVLSACPFFLGMTENEILSILHCVNGRAVPVAAGSTLMRAGDIPRDMGLVLRGTLLIAQEDVWGHRNLLTRCAAGDFFAEAYAAAAKPLSVSVTAQTDSEVLLLDVRKLLTACPTACAHHSHLIRNMVNVLSEKVLLFHDKLSHVSRRTTREKLLSYLSEEAIRQGRSTFYIPFDRQQLADYLCVERSAMSTELTRLTKEGLLTTKRNLFILHTDTPEEKA